MPDKDKNQIFSMWFLVCHRLCCKPLSSWMCNPMLTTAKTRALRSGSGGLCAVLGLVKPLQILILWKSRRLSKAVVSIHLCCQGRHSLPSIDDSVIWITKQYTQTPVEAPPSSDDDPYTGQVTPHHLISPVLHCVQEINPPSDDSNMSSSPLCNLATC